MPSAWGSDTMVMTSLSYLAAIVVLILVLMKQDHSTVKTFNVIALIIVFLGVLLAYNKYQTKTNEDAAYANSDEGKSLQTMGIFVPVILFICILVYLMTHKRQ